MPLALTIQVAEHFMNDMINLWFIGKINFCLKVDQHTCHHHIVNRLIDEKTSTTGEKASASWTADSHDIIHLLDHSSYYVEYTYR